MKSLTLLFSVSLLVFGCAHEEATSKKETKLLFEEYYTYDPASSSSPDGFVSSYKLAYHYDQGKLIQVSAQDYNPLSHAYEPSYLLEEYSYNNQGKLVEQLKIVGAVGWIYEYNYSNTQTKVTRYESINGNFNLTDWWTIERATSSLDVKYYQGDNGLYEEVVAEIDGRGNVVTLSTSPALSVGKIYYTYDHAPNPYKFPALSGEYLSAGKYQSENNVIEVTNDLNAKSAVSISYNTNGYPVSIITTTSKRVLTYQ